LRRRWGRESFPLRYPVRGWIHKQKRSKRKQRQRQRLRKRKVRKKPLQKLVLHLSRKRERRGLSVC
jgi:hypothetical protein